MSYKPCHILGVTSAPLSHNPKGIAGKEFLKKTNLDTKPSASEIWKWYSKKPSNLAEENFMNWQSWSNLTEASKQVYRGSRIFSLTRKVQTSSE